MLIFQAEIYIIQIETNIGKYSLRTIYEKIPLLPSVFQFGALWVLMVTISIVSPELRSTLLE